jgi:hypothetical protein
MNPRRFRALRRRRHTITAGAFSTIDGGAGNDNIDSTLGTVLTTGI